MRLLKNKKGLSAVVTTLIILVVSVLLATVVTFYAINVTSTRVQEEDLTMQKAHIWYDADNSVAIGAFVLVNTGGRDVVIDKITVRGQEVSWSNVYYNVSTRTPTSDLTINATALASGVSLHSESGQYYNASTTSSDITLKSSYTMVVYMVNPDSISLNDVGTTVSITVYTMNAEYYKECNVQAAS